MSPQPAFSQPRKLWRWLTRPRRGHLKIYLFEIVILLNVIALHGVLHRSGLGIRFAALQYTVVIASQTLIPLFLIGCLLRLGYSAARGRARIYLRRVLTWSWLFLSLRLILAGTLVIHVYGWLKGLLRLVRPALYDELLWNLDRALLLGISPNIFSLNAFGEPAMLKFIDITYGGVFIATLAISIPFFFSMASDRLRLAFATGCSWMWLAGAWLYFLVPSMGPCYAFPDVWAPFVENITASMQSQAYLFNNYQLVPMVRQGIIHQDFNLMAGIAAFPSLHVASQVFLALWFRRVLPWARLACYLSIGLIFIGSIVTGWHYLVDSLAGALLGWACFRLSYSLYGLRRGMG